MKSMVERKSKSQMGWRLPNSDEALYSPLFRLGYSEKMHLIPHGEVGPKWNSFVNKLFDTQQGFIGRERGSTNSIRTQWDGRIETFKNKFGWENGNTGTIESIFKYYTNK
jgi:hypothetical protein